MHQEPESRRLVDVRRAVTRMARILRYTLGQKEDTVELARELEVVDDYLALEQLRLGSLAARRGRFASAAACN